MPALVVLRDGTTPVEVPFEQYRFTFPISSAELTAEHIEQFGLKDGLVKFAAALFEQLAGDVVGIQIHEIGVTFLKKRKDQEDR